MQGVGCYSRIGAEAFSAKLNQVAEALRKTFTYDQGKEMSRHKVLTECAKVQACFCDPHNPWRRGSCENTSGLLRQFLPKGTDLSVRDLEALDSITDLMNNRPRLTLDWRSSYEAFMQFMKAMEQQKTATIH